jgi:Secretion system C-terminal sorting domain
LFCITTLEQKNEKIKLLETQTERPGKKTVVIYPNLADNSITIQSGEQFRQILVMDANGKIIQQLNNQPATVKIDVGRLASGVYFIKLIGDDVTVTEKFIKQ